MDTENIENIEDTGRDNFIGKERTEEMPQGVVEEDFARENRMINRHDAVSIEVEDDRTAADRVNNRPSSQLRAKILALPEAPGIYLYLDRKGKVIYVGKAKRLKRRVSSYFNRQHQSNKTNQLVRNIVDMRFVETTSEEEALQLEARTIHEYQPRYNIMLKDDKSYPWIVVTREEYPRVFMTREKGLDARYYGPYSNVGAAKVVLDLIRELFPLRSCRHNIDAAAISRGKLRLCLDFHINKCLGVCRGMVSREAYNGMIEQVREILRGDTHQLLAKLRSDMDRESRQLRFEEAQLIKEKIAYVEKYKARSVVASEAAEDVDVIGYVENNLTAYVNFMHLHHGAAVQTVAYAFRRRMSETREEILSLAIGRVMDEFGREFSELLVPFMPDIEFSRLHCVVPVRGDKRKILELAQTNARRYMEDMEKQAEALDPERGVERLMERMKSDFRLQVQPRHIECFDNSNIQGSNPVASCVVFRNGKPCKRDYRHFNIKTVVGADDFASMKEVLHRRYTRMMAEGEPLPQLVVVDGGKGQLSAAVEAFDEMGIRGDVALIGIAKRLEEIYFPGDSLPLYIDKKSESLRVIQALRDEAHRFGITHHRNRRSKGQVKSELDGIRGIGPATIETLMKKFKSVKRISEAPLDDIAAVVGKAKAKILREHFLRKETTASRALP